MHKHTHTHMHTSERPPIVDFLDTVRVINLIMYAGRVYRYGVM